MGDVLSHILTNAKNRGFIKGLIPHFVDGGLTHSQYNKKYQILIILFWKYVWAQDQLWKIRSDCDGMWHREAKGSCPDAELQNRKISYHILGIPISNMIIRASDLEGTKQKIRKRLATWQCK